MANEKASEKKKTKLPTPLKRRKQDIKKALNNKIVKSKIHTARGKFTAQAEGSEGKKELLSTLFSLIDKAAKKGVFKKNKANRLKSRLHAKA